MAQVWLWRRCAFRVKWYAFRVVRRKCADEVCSAVTLLSKCSVLLRLLSKGSVCSQQVQRVFSASAACVLSKQQQQVQLEQQVQQAAASSSKQQQQQVFSASAACQCALVQHSAFQVVIWCSNWACRRSQRRT